MTQSQIDNFYSEAGRRIRRIRQRRQLSQAALGDVIGVSGSSVARIELGQQHVTIVAAAQIADALGTTVGRLFPLGMVHS